MLAALKGHGVSDRKLRLFVCAVARRVWPVLDDAGRAAVEVAERLADGSAGDGERGAAMREANQAAQDTGRVHRESECATSPRFVLAAHAATSACGTPGEFATNAVRSILWACGEIACDPESALGGLDHERAAEFHSEYHHHAVVEVAGDRLRVTSKGTFVEVLDARDGRQLSREVRKPSPP
jgi:hypothetical protein